jgi:hypothetical protein
VTESGWFVAAALAELGISENVATVSRRFIEGEFAEGYFDEQKRLREARSRVQKSVRKRSKVAKGKG